jgi:hypothetical protein
MSKNFEQFRDEKLRREILLILKGARKYAPKHGLSGDRLFAEVNVPLSEGMGLEDGSHLLGLCHDLVGAELVKEIDKGTRREYELTVKPNHLFYEITFKGMQLLEEKISPVPGIADERAVN